MPSANAEVGVKVHVPSGLTVIGDPIDISFLKTSIDAPISVTPVRVGVLSFVILSLSELPKSELDDMTMSEDVKNNAQLSSVPVPPILLSTTSSFQIPFVNSPLKVFNGADGLNASV